MPRWIRTIIIIRKSNEVIQKVNTPCNAIEYYDSFHFCSCYVHVCQIFWPISLSNLNTFITNKYDLPIPIKIIITIINPVLIWVAFLHNIIDLRDIWVAFLMLLCNFKNNLKVAFQHVIPQQNPHWKSSKPLLLCNPHP